MARNFNKKISEFSNPPAQNVKENGEKVGQQSFQTHWHRKPQEDDLKTKQ